MTGLGLQELSMLCLPITAHSLRLVAWAFSLATEHSTITQRKFWRRITRSHFKKRWHSPSTIRSSRIPHTMRIADRYRFSRAGYMPSSSAFPDTCSASYVSRLAAGTLVLLAACQFLSKRKGINLLANRRVDKIAEKKAQVGNYIANMSVKKWDLKRHDLERR